MALLTPESPTTPRGKKTQKRFEGASAESVRASEKINRIYALMFQKREFFSLPNERERLEAYEKARGRKVEYCEEMGAWPLLCGTPEIEEPLGEKNLYPTGQLRALASADYEPEEEIYEYKGHFVDITEEESEPEKDHYNFYLNIGSRKIRVDANNLIFAAKYINQTLKPNTEYRLKNKADGNPKLVVVAIAKIKRWQELGISYGDKNFKATDIERTSLAEIFIAAIRGFTADEIRKLEERVLYKLDKLNGNFSSYILELLHNPYSSVASNRHRHQLITWEGICHIFDWSMPRDVRMLVTPSDKDMEVEPVLGMIPHCSAFSVVPRVSVAPKATVPFFPTHVSSAEDERILRIRFWLQQVHYLRYHFFLNDTQLLDWKKRNSALCKKFYAFGLEPPGIPPVEAEDGIISTEEKEESLKHDEFYKYSKMMIMWLCQNKNSSDRIYNLIFVLSRMFNLNIDESGYLICLNTIEKNICNMVQHLKRMPKLIQEQRNWHEALNNEFVAVMACLQQEKEDRGQLPVNLSSAQEGKKRARSMSVADVAEGYCKVKSVAASGLFSEGVSREGGRNLPLYIRSFECDISVLREATIKQHYAMLEVFTAAYKSLLLRALKLADEYNADIQFYESLTSHDLKEHFSGLSRAERKAFRENFKAGEKEATIIKPVAQRPWAVPRSET